jgi:hypothetical protein
MTIVAPTSADPRIACVTILVVVSPVAWLLEEIKRISDRRTICGDLIVR